ncbi:unnamed protein product [Agarophyton chilense]|eukprot:gb/GEZJ01004375.1/.p1 GENE.gb/GEZJ01004375.1/~~gb/GEZJ01004375.1/.p1  ORF type:complete len:607 (-),score=103.61 gb/GEZJ01004375.1/:565-2385(-)
MSLRDLASGTSCAAGGASSSSNPLAALTDAILPKTATPAARFGDPRASHPESSSITPQEHALIQGKLLSNPLFHQSVPPPHPLPPPAAPASLADAYAKGTQSWPFSNRSAPHIVPERGAATDVFEAAFREATVRHVPPSAPYRPLSRLHLYRQPSQLLHVPQLVPRFSMPAPQQIQRPAASSHVDEYLSTLKESDAMDRLSKLSVSDPHSSSRGAKEQPTETNAHQRSFLDTESWGEEFTSFENEDLADFADVANETTIPERFAFSGDIEKYFERWIRSENVERYEFDQQQSKSKRSAEKTLEEGIRSRELGRLSLAIQCFEEALQHSSEDRLSSQSRATAWYLLGISQAETDNDVRAIQAFQEGLSEWQGASVGERREDNPYLWQSLIALSVSYTNELDAGKALRHMCEWYRLWSQRDRGDTESGVPSSMWQSEDTGAGVLLEQLRRAASQSPNDIDLFVVMGILHNLRQEFEDAAIAFRHAITIRSEDPCIWNKLGATLANGGDSDNALRAYRKAVDLNPSLIRAWVNVGTAYSNRAEFTKAARYYLKAISMAEEETHKLDGRDNSASHVWEFLGTALTSLGQTNLQQLADMKDLQALRAHFNL